LATPASNQRFDHAYINNTQSDNLGATIRTLFDEDRDIL
jgi:hypothetical protein